MSRVLFAGGGTGGHLYPALNLAEALRAERPDLQVHFVGARRGVEARVLPAKHEPHTLLPFEPLRRERVWRNWRLASSSFGVARGLAVLFHRFRPRLVVGTGGYASGPACAWALLSGTPMALQEQNAQPGLTTRWLSRWARQVHLGFPEAAHELRPGPDTRVYELGNPIRPPDRSLDRDACRRSFDLAAEGVVALVVGGSQGAQAINEALVGALEGLATGALPARPDGLQLLWATGPSHLEGACERIDPLGLNDWVHPVGYIDDMPAALRAADLALSRAGAIAIAELLAWGVPALLVPLPTAAADHQARNARALADAGAAVHLPQSGLSPGRLWAELTGLARDEPRRARMASRARARGRPDAAREIAGKLLTLVEA